MRLSITLYYRGQVVLAAMSIFAFGACTNATTSVAPAAKTVGSPQISSLGYNWYPVNNPGNTENEVTGINGSDDIVGNYTSKANLSNVGGNCTGQTGGGGGGTCSDCPLPSGTAKSGGIYWTSYTSEYQGNSGPYHYFVQRKYPDAEWQYLFAIGERVTSAAQSTVEVGCVVYFGGDSGELTGTWGVVDNGGLWNVISKPSGSNNCQSGLTTGTSPGRDPIAALVGYDSANELAVGYYNYYHKKNPDCPLEPWQDQPGDNDSPLNLGGSGTGWTTARATGISNTNPPFVVGTATTTGSGRQVGWYVKLQSSGSVPTQTSYPNSTATAFTGVTATSGSSTPVIVGWYTDSASHTHGLLYDSTSVPPYTSIDEPSANGYTVVSGINSKGNICGWFLDSNGHYEGFVGISKVGLHRRHRHNPARPSIIGTR